MAVNIFQVGDINANLFGTGSNPTASTTGVYASEYPLYPDNINGQLSRYTKIMGIWPSSFINSSTGFPAGSGGNDSWAQPNGSAGEAWRPNGSYYARGVYTTDQNPPSSSQYLSYGYIGAFVGGYDKLDYTHDSNPGPITGNQIIAVDYEPPYGHGAGTGINIAPINNSYTNEWRDSNNVTQDPNAQLTVNSSNYNRDPYSAPAYFACNIDSPTTTLGSGNVQFHVEMRPTRLMTAYGGNAGGLGSSTISVSAPCGSRAPIRTDVYEFFPFTGIRKFGSRALSIFMGRIFDGQANMFSYPLYEDSTIATFVSGGTTFSDQVYAGTAQYDCPTSRPPVVNGIWTPAVTFVVTAATTAVGGNTTYTGVFPQLPVPGSSIKILGFITNPSNNGTFVVQTASNTTLVLNNAAGVAESHAATAQNVVAPNYEIIDYNGHIQKATTAGTSGTTFPVFSQIGGTVVDGSVVWTDQGLVNRTTYITDARIRQMAHQTINNEYYNLVQETKFAIMSNKCTTYPLVFADLLDTWNTGTWAAGYRIAGSTVWSCSIQWQPAHTYTVGQAVLDPFGFIQVVTSISGTGTSGNTTPFTSANAVGAIVTDNPGGNQIVWTNSGLNKSKIFYIAENGSIAVYDSNIANGLVTNLFAAPALLTGQAYGACRIPNGSSTLYAITGCFTANPAVPSTDTGGSPGFVGVTPYNIIANTWGSASFPALINGRHNARSLGEMITLRNGWLALMVERVGVVTTTVTNTAAGTGPDFVDWQVLLFNPTGSVWNANQIYSDGTTNFSFGTPSGSSNNAPLYYENAYNCAIFDVSPTVAGGTSPVILVQSNWRNDKLFVIDGSQSLATISNSNVTNVSQGSAKDLLTGIASTSQPNNGGTPNPSPLQIKKSSTDDRVLFWFNEFYSFINTNGTNPTTNIYLAPPSWVLSNWNGATGVQLVAFNAKDGEGNITTIAKDKMWLTDCSNLQGIGDPWSFLSHFLDNTVSVIIHGEVASNAGSGEWGLHPSSVPTPLYAGHNWGGQFFLPTYFKWNQNTLSAAGTASNGITPYTGTFVLIPVAGSYVTIAGFTNTPNNGVFQVAPGSTSSTLLVFNSGGVSEAAVATTSQFIMADNWADALANPATVSATPSTNISLPYGLVGQFGTTSGSSFALNEWHTINACWGNTKFVRKARYVWAMFAGQTFLTSQTVPMSTINAVTPSVILPEAFGVGNVTWSYPSNYAAPWTYGGGPSGVVTPIDNYITCMAFPMVNAGAGQNSPVQLTMTVNHPDVSTLLNRPNQSGQSYSSDSAQSGIVGSYGPVSYAFNGCPYNAWFSSRGANGWASIDLGAAQTCRSYSFIQQFPATNTNQTQSMTGWQLLGSNSSSDFTTGPSTSGSPTSNGTTWVTLDTRTGITATRAWAGNSGNSVAYRYYALRSTTVTNNYTTLSLFRLFSSTLQSTVNFSEITAFGPNFLGSSASSMAPQMMRGMTFEVSTDHGSTYTVITPIWRAHLGGVWCFDRQTGVTNIRITALTGYPYFNNYNTNALGGTNTYNGYLAFGPFKFVDYQGATSTAARLGNGGAGGSTLSVPPGQPTAGSYDPNCIGVACDAVSVSIDGTVSPASLIPQYIGSDFYASGNGLSPVYGWWTFTQIPTGTLSTFPNGSIRVHPFFGFVLFGGAAGLSQSWAGGSDQQQTMPGTNMTIAYHWGRRV